MPVAAARSSTGTPRRSSDSSWKSRSGVAIATSLEQLGRPDVVDGRLGGVGVEAGPALLERAHRLLQRLGEGAADAHDLAHRLHPGAEHVGGAGELLEGPPGDLGDHVVDDRLEGGRASPR